MADKNKPLPQTPGDVEDNESMDRAELGGPAPGQNTQSIVFSCTVTGCVWNRDEQCTAGSIQVAYIDGAPQCATFAPGEDGGSIFGTMNSGQM